MSSTITHTGVGQVSNTSGLGYSFSFATLNREDIQVEIIDPSNVKTTKTITTHYTIENYSVAGSSNSYIEFISETARGFTNSQTTYKVRITRQTPSTPKVNFTAGSSITASDLNTQGKQAFHLSEENRDSITSLAAGDASGAIQISGSNIADNSITTSKILDLEVGTNDLGNLSVTTGKIADDAVTTDKLANSINTTIAGKANTGANLSTFANDTNYITLAQVPASFVTGMIIMWNTTVATIPSGWVLCDGNNNTPDLRARFIVGVGDGTGAGNSNYSVGNSGGAEQVTLTTAQIPSHTHTHIKAVHPASSGPEQNQSGGAEDRSNFNVSATTGSAGGGAAHENRPPYYALAFIMKT